MKKLKAFLLATFVLTATVSTLKAQHQKSSVLSDVFIEKLLTERKFVFTTYFIGEDFTGRPLLSPDYNFSVSDNKIFAELPYVGSSYGNISFTSFAPYLKLNSTNYYYKALAYGNEVWQVLIKPLDKKQVKAIVLDITKNGYASLNIVNNKGKTITYNGSINSL
ncbi:DUF4251 domain-containing protein [uncultured Mucilaginibacter sp.]|uniref:DUF4251 domain-containing protein n=1 Tax=uncultured Mucilaginibacter sp. TaxID=797541 RepID=UPI0026265BFA|nr:DUF4251 domain-containing protein [uncultured Mucilaginibacter sp.]